MCKEPKNSGQDKKVKFYQNMFDQKQSLYFCTCVEFDIFIFTTAFWFLAQAISPSTMSDVSLIT